MTLNEFKNQYTSVMSTLNCRAIFMPIQFVLRCRTPHLVSTKIGNLRLVQTEYSIKISPTFNA